MPLAAVVAFTSLAVYSGLIFSPECRVSTLAGRCVLQCACQIILLLRLLRRYELFLLESSSLVEEFLGAVFTLPAWEAARQNKIAGFSCEMSK